MAAPPSRGAGLFTNSIKLAGQERVVKARPEPRRPDSYRERGKGTPKNVPEREVIFLNYNNLYF